MAKKKKKNWNQVKLICNPEAGDIPNTTERIEQATCFLMDLGFQVDVALAKPKKLATDLARKAVKDGYRTIIAFGGDGTIEAVARGLVGMKADLGIIPSGTMNNIARSLSIPDDLQAACALIQEHPRQKLDAGQIKTKKKGKFYFFEVAAVGLSAALYPKGKDLFQDMSRRDLISLVDVAKTMLLYKMPEVKLTLDGDSKLKVKSMLVTVANTPAYGFTFLVAPGASVNDGRLDICLYPNFTKPQLIAYFTRIARGRLSDDRHVQRFQAGKIKVKSKPKLKIMADGEMFGKGTVTIRSLPHALRVIAPHKTGISVESQMKEEKMPEPIAPFPSNEREREQRQRQQASEVIAEQLREVVEPSPNTAS